MLEIVRRKEIKGMNIGKEGTKLSLFSDNLMVCLENSRGPAKKQTEIINRSNKVVRHTRKN